MKKVLAVLFLLAGIMPAFAQSGAAVKQSGNVTPGQVPWWITSGVIGGGVTSADSPITSFGVTNNGGNGFCVNSDRVTAAGRNTLCLGTLTNGVSTISAQNYGTATAQDLKFCVNGTCYSAGGTISNIAINTTTISNPTPGCSILFYNGGTLSCTDGSTGSAQLFTSNTFNITPPVGLTRALNIVQTGTTGGSTAGPLYFNSIAPFFNSTVTGTRNVAGLQVSLGVGGSANATEIYGGSFGATATASGITGELVGLSGGAEILAGFSVNNSIFGSVAAATVNVGASTPVAVGFESGVAIFAAAGVPIRYGVNIDNYGAFPATGMDTALSIQGGFVGGSWKRGITFTNPGNALAPALATTGIMFSSEVAMTVNTIFDFSNVTATSLVLNTPNTQLTGAGILTLGSATSAGAIVLAGGTSDSLTTNYLYNTVSKWLAGGVAGTYFITATGAGANALQIDHTTNQLSAPSGLAVTGAFTGTAALVLGTYLQTGAVAVGSLPSCAAGTKGARDFVTDSNAASFTAGIGAVVAAGGSTNVPVVCDGTNWRIG